MNEWTSGYVADIDYTYGYYPELSPKRCELALLNAGIRPPKFRTACELGFGQGISVNYHAAATETEWYGTDFNPAQAGFAQELSEECGSGAKLFDEAFVDFCNRGDLPGFDYIGLHGIWSWISDENRTAIVDFVRRKLNVGGVLYVSYNTLPGWASFAPLRNLMTQHAEVIGSEGRGIVSRIDEAMQFAQALLETNPLYKRANPQVEERLKSMLDKSRHYLAHEYFNKDWDPMHFATLARWMSPAKLDFAASGNLLDHFDGVNLSAEQMKFVRDIPDPMLRQSVKDFMINQHFRRDYWVKGLRKLSTIERNEALGSLNVILASSRDDISLKVNGGQGEIELNDKIYNPILDSLADHQPVTIAELSKRAEKLNKDITPQAVVEATMVLCALNVVFPVETSSSVSKIKKKTDKLNRLLMRKARSEKDLNFLASPVTGGGIPVNRLNQLFLSAYKEGENTPEKMAQSAWRLLEQQGERLLKDGKALESADDNLKDLADRANDFRKKLLPIINAVQI